MALPLGALQHGDRAAREVSQRIAGNFATTTAMGLLSAKKRNDGMLATVGTQVWQYNAASTASASATVIVPDDAPSAGRWLVVVGNAVPNFQSGVATLVAGTVTVASVTLTANSRIFLSRKTQGGTITTTIGYEAPSASRNTGASTFVINAVVAAGTTQTSDTSVIDWLVVG